ncbi:alpha/beta fold hydrolase [Herminiimonas contaminans]|uniref:Alpha/beta hydrolase n=1 Tax=Herminiimonas contaminans TaxID=1111140 RepID=A0ABS0EXT4_9BURK|nr:alpha/beta hydrolase [Herminiimonas contaminans]MBF8178637.1 alpha/beta hydrolase [Herminiimonas contaminans]
MTTTFLYGAHIQANGIRQHYLRYGGKLGARAERDAIIIIPGITSPAITWGFVGERLGQYFDTYILDVRGRGLSSANAELDYSLETQATDVIEFAKALGLRNYAIVGHSMGGRIGIRAARTQATGLTSLVMIDPPVSGPGRRAYPSQLAWYVDSMRYAREGCSVEQMRTFCPSWSQEQLQLRAEWLHTCDERAVIESFNGFHSDDIHQDLPHIKIPSLLIVAGRGNVLMPQDIEEICSLMPQVKVAHVQNAGHMIPWDDESGFYAAFGDFLGTRF